MSLYQFDIVGRREAAISRTDAAILGMLTIEPMSGYDMKKFCEQSLAHFWHENYGNLYPRLKRLQAGGLIRGRRQRRARGPQAIVYSLAPAGRSRFRRWLRQKPEPERVRSELLLKIFFGAQAEPAGCAAMIRDHRQQQEALRDRYASIERMLREELADTERPDVPFWLMTLRRGQILTDARLRWCRESEALFESRLPETGQ
jgi:DNA-binding PadR family transcriptional regulator